MAIIRLVTPADASFIRTQFFAHLSPEKQDEYQASHPMEMARLDGTLKGDHGICLVAESGSQIIGFIIGNLAPCLIR